MELLINTANPIVVLALTAVIVGIIFVSKKFEQRPLLIIAIIVLIGLLIYHSVFIEKTMANSELHVQGYYCLAVDLVMLLVSFIAFLWVDSIIAKNKKIKSYDDSLNWFWEKI